MLGSISHLVHIVGKKYWVRLHIIKNTCQADTCLVNVLDEFITILIAQQFIARTTIFGHNICFMN